jgi:hypothetical protein
MGNGKPRPLGGSKGGWRQAMKLVNVLIASGMALMGSLTVAFAQGTVPLTIVSVYSEYTGCLTDPPGFNGSETDPLENHIVGFEFLVTLRFKIEREWFWADPRF